MLSSNVKSCSVERKTAPEYGGYLQYHGVRDGFLESEDAVAALPALAKRSELWYHHSIGGLNATVPRLYLFEIYDMNILRSTMKI